MQAFASKLYSKAILLYTDALALAPSAEVRLPLHRLAGAHPRHLHASGVSP